MKAVEHPERLETMEPTTATVQPATVAVQQSNRNAKWRVADTLNTLRKQHEFWKKFMYDSENGKIMQRSPKSWLLLISFYLAFYGVLAVFWALMLAVVLQTLRDDRPKWAGSASVMSTDLGSGWGPAVGFEPWPLDKKHVQFFDKISIYLNDNTANQCINRLQEIFNAKPPKYENSDLMTKLVSDNCGDDGNYGYKLKTYPDESTTAAAAAAATNPERRPCVFLTLNKIFDWIPIPYPRTSSAAGYAIPDDLQSYLNELKRAADATPLTPASRLLAENTTNINASTAAAADTAQNAAVAVADDPSMLYDPTRVYFTCKAMNDDGRGLKIAMIPSNGIEISDEYFPYTKQQGYLAPFVVAKFSNLQSRADNNPYEIECRAFASNIPYNPAEGLGMVRFDIGISDGSARMRLDSADEV